MIVLMAGLPATGKSTLARELGRRTSGRVLSKDEVRHALFLPGEIEYSTGQDDFCLNGIGMTPLHNTAGEKNPHSSGDFLAVLLVKLRKQLGYSKLACPSVLA